MKQLEQTKGITKLVPAKVKRYFVTSWSKANGWQIGSIEYFTTPESAVARFIDNENRFSQSEEYKAEFYKVIEVELEIPTL